MMYLSTAITDTQGERYPMVGALPQEFTMNPPAHAKLDTSHIIICCGEDTNFILHRCLEKLFPWQIRFALKQLAHGVLPSYDITISLPPTPSTLPKMAAPHPF